MHSILFFPPMNTVPESMMMTPHYLPVFFRFLLLPLYIIGLPILISATTSTPLFVRAPSAMMPPRPTFLGTYRGTDLSEFVTLRRDVLSFTKDTSACGPLTAGLLAWCPLQVSECVFLRTFPPCSEFRSQSTDCPSCWKEYATFSQVARTGFYPFPRHHGRTASSAFYWSLSFCSELGKLMMRNS